MHVACDLNVIVKREVLQCYKQSHTLEMG